MRQLNLFYLAAICSAAVLFQACTGNNGTVSVDEKDTEASARPVKLSIEEPLANIEVGFNILTIKNQEAQTLNLPSGSSIDIPAHAFVDKTGRPVTGPVDIQFREFHNAAEILTSGVPMKVLDGQGGENWMQTAGMYEIKGSSNGERVFVAPDKSLTVNLVSQVGGDYDFWKFDPEKGNWDNLGVSTPVPNPAATKSPAAANPSLKKPVAPVAYNPAKTKIDLELNYQKFPELRDKQGVIWQLVKEENIDWIYNTEWDAVNIEATGEANIYRLSLSNDSKNFSTLVAACLQEKDFAKARAEYQVKLREYQSKVMDLDEKRNYKSAQAEFVRSFQIDGFGIYNYDILTKDNGNIPILAHFDFGTDIPKNLLTSISVFLITGEGRMVVKYPHRDWNKFRVDPDADNQLVAVLPGNQLAVFSHADFRSQMPALRKSAGQEYVFKMKLDDKPVESVAEVQQRISDLAL